MMDIDFSRKSYAEVDMIIKERLDELNKLLRKYDTIDMLYNEFKNLTDAIDSYFSAGSKEKDVREKDIACIMEKLKSVESALEKCESMGCKNDENVRSMRNVYNDIYDIIYSTRTCENMKNDIDNIENKNTNDDTDSDREFWEKVNKSLDETSYIGYS